MSIDKQVHTDFKVFTGKPAADGGLGHFAADVSRFAAEHKVAAKSIGVEYIEATGDVVVSLGYRAGTDSDPPYPIKVSSVSIGKFTAPLDAKAIEDGMGQAAKSVENVICHEFYVKEDGEFFVVFMSRG